LNNRFAAFTIFELLIAMVLTSILVTMALVGLGLLKKQQIIYNQGNEQMMAIRQLKDWLKIDQERCSYLIREGNNLICAYEKRKVVYKITPEQIIRSQFSNQMPIDTFWVSTAKWDTQFLNRNQEKGIIDKFNLEVVYGEQPYPIVIHKNYSASNLIHFKNEH